MTEGLSPASELCLSCGMCCAGDIHSIIALRPGEADRAKASGFDVGIDETDGQPCAALPCRHLDGTACTIYDAWRPGTCSDYLCRLQVNLADGKIALAEAVAEVGRIKTLIAARLPETARRPLRELVIEAAERTGSGQIDPASARLVLEVGTINREIDRVIRHPHQGTFQR